MNKYLLFALLFIVFGCEKKETEVPTGTGEISMGLPYVSGTNIQAIFEAYSTGSDSPWGFAHNGIDFTPKSNLVPFRSVASGKVTELKLWKNDKSVNYQVNLGIQYNAVYTVVYTFEPFSDKQSDGQNQLSNISVTLGQNVSEGQQIGKLFVVGNGAHLHFGLNKNGTATCPETYFQAAAKDSLLTMIHKTHPNWNLCY